jgi:tetratricopeptide (TPR) repeat protein
VVSPSRHGTRNSDFEWQQVRGMETRIQDYQFLLPRVKAMFQLKEPSVALMGIGMSVSDGLLWMMRNKSVKTLVSMEGGILTQFEYDMMKNSPYYNLESLTNPILVFYTPHRDINPALVNGFKHTERHIFYLPQMTEFYFLNYGAWQSIMPGILGKAPGDTRRSYKYAFAYILSFLSWQLKADSGAETDFRETPQQKQYDTALIQYSFKEKMEIPPSATDLENRWVKSGIDEVIRFLEPKLKDDPEFISNTSFSYLGAQLINHHRAFNDCIKWCQLFARQYPNASSAQSMQGRSYLELNQPEKAKIAYEKALELLNDDPYLTLPQRQGLKNALKQRLSNFSTR